MNANPPGLPEAILPDVPGQREMLDSWLSGSQRKTAYALRQNCETMIAGHHRRKLVKSTLANGKECINWRIEGEALNLNRTGFLTLTVGDVTADGKFKQVFDASEASRRINNLNRRVLSVIFEKAIIVTERHKSGAIHFHVLGILASGLDIRTGFDFVAVRRRDYRSASPALRDLWRMLREKLPAYGFGRAELMPIEKTGEAIAAYISKYIEKNVCNRRPEDKRKKLVRYLGWEKSQLKPNDFSWGTPGSCIWRENARKTAALIGVTEREEFADLIGPRWGFWVTQKFQALGKPFWRLDFGEVEILRAELVREIGEREARRRDGKKRFLADEIRELNASWESGEFKPRWCPPPPKPARWGKEISLPCIFPKRKIAWGIPGTVPLEKIKFLTPCGVVSR